MSRFFMVQCVHPASV